MYLYDGESLRKVGRADRKGNLPGGGKEWEKPPCLPPPPWRGIWKPFTLNQQKLLELYIILVYKLYLFVSTGMLTIFFLPIVNQVTSHQLLFCGQ